MTMMVSMLLEGPDSDVQLRRRRERYWIYHLKSLAPGGLNLDE